MYIIYIYIKDLNFYEYTKKRRSMDCPFGYYLSSWLEHAPVRLLIIISVIV